MFISFRFIFVQNSRINICPKTFRPKWEFHKMGHHAETRPEPENDGPRPPLEEGEGEDCADGEASRHLEAAVHQTLVPFL
jgi:hypothetical protein